MFRYLTCLVRVLALPSFAIWRIIRLFLVEVIILWGRELTGVNRRDIVRKTVSYYREALWVLKRKM